MKQHHRPPPLRTKVSMISDRSYVTAIKNPIYLGGGSTNNNNTDDNKKDLRFPIEMCSDVLISNACGVMDVPKLKAMGITHVLNVGGTKAMHSSLLSLWNNKKNTTATNNDNNNNDTSANSSSLLSSLLDAYREAGITYKIIEGACDTSTYPMLENHWEECQDFLDSFRRTAGRGRCVVHCQAGVNRSGCIVAADYMVTHQTNILETFRHCRQQLCHLRRGGRTNAAFVSNHGFQCQLVAFARNHDLLGPPPGHPDCIVDPILWKKQKQKQKQTKRQPNNATTATMITSATSIANMIHHNNNSATSIANRIHHNNNSNDDRDKS